jgi:IS5 family transposase
MGQLGFFDVDKRLAALSAKGDPLEAIDRLVPWESFRADIEAVVLTPEDRKKSNAGRRSIDAIVMFRMLVLQAVNNLSDEQVEFHVRDQLSFSRFLRLGMEDSIPDATALWLFREKPADAGPMEKLFDRFDQHLAAQGYLARGGQMIDGTIVAVPKQRNSRDENETVKSGQTPAEWEKNPAKLRQKDLDARWTKKNDRSFFGYKNHVNADAKHKLIRRYEVTYAAVHDSQMLEALLDRATTTAHDCRDASTYGRDGTSVPEVLQASSVFLRHASGIVFNSVTGLSEPAQLRSPAHPSRPRCKSRINNWVASGTVKYRGTYCVICGTPSRRIHTIGRVPAPWLVLFLTALRSSQVAQAGPGTSRLIAAW